MEGWKINKILVLCFLSFILSKKQKTTANAWVCSAWRISSLEKATIFLRSRPNAVRIMGHKGERGAVRVCPRSFLMSPSTSLIPSPSSYHISASPAVGESPHPYQLWCPEDPAAQFVITVRPSESAATCRPSSTVIYKIVLISPTFLRFSPHFRRSNVLQVHPCRYGWVAYVAA